MDTRTIRRWVVTTLAVATFGSTTVAAATGLGGMTSGRLGAGSARVERCDPDGITLSYNVTLGKVKSVVVSGLHAGCTGGELRLLLVDSSGTIVGSGGPLPVAGASLTVPVTPEPAAATVKGEHILIEAP